MTTPEIKTSLCCFANKQLAFRKLARSSTRNPDSLFCNYAEDLLGHNGDLEIIGIKKKAGIFVSFSNGFRDIWWLYAFSTSFVAIDSESMKGAVVEWRGLAQPEAVCKIALLFEVALEEYKRDTAALLLNYLEKLLKEVAPVRRVEA